MNNNNRVLIIAAHPDDEVLGCGGTIARLAREGRSVYIVILGEGVTSRYPQRGDADPSMIRVLHDRSQKVAKLLKAEDLFIFNLPDNRFDTLPLLDFTKIIEDIIKKVDPSLIFTQHGGDLNADHGIVHRATLIATRPVGGNNVRAVYAYETASSTEWSFQKINPIFNPNVFIDISQTLELKLRAMELYEDEIRTFPHPRSVEALRANAQRWGSVAGLLAAEAFELIREIR